MRTLRLHERSSARCTMPSAPAPIHERPTTARRQCDDRLQPGVGPPVCAAGRPGGRHRGHRLPPVPFRGSRCRNRPQHCRRRVWSWLPAAGAHVPRITGHADLRTRRLGRRHRLRPPGQTIRFRSRDEPAVQGRQNRPPRRNLPMPHVADAAIHLRLDPAQLQRHQRGIE